MISNVDGLYTVIMNNENSTYGMIDYSIRKYMMYKYVKLSTDLSYWMKWVESRDNITTSFCAGYLDPAAANHRDVNAMDKDALLCFQWY
jgi:hypothetical protein